MLIREKERLHSRVRLDRITMGIVFRSACKLLRTLIVLHQRRGCGTVGINVGHSPPPSEHLPPLETPENYHCGHRA